MGTDQQLAIDALTRHGARQEGQFIRTRKPLGAEDPRALDAAAIGGLTLLSWPEVTSRGLLEQVRQLQFDTFLEHFGNMSKTPEVWQQHIESRSFAPDFSVAAVTDSDTPTGAIRVTKIASSTGTPLAGASFAILGCGVNYTANDD